MTASTRLLTGPAARDDGEIAARVIAGCRKSTGTGLAQPISGTPVVIASSGNSSVPMGSMCTTGFRDSRPSMRAVGSPS